MNADEQRAKRAAWQRRWRANSDKIGATIYLTQHDQRLDSDPDS